jgi:uncharacterized protein YndB with AHSA1/START domain
MKKPKTLSFTIERTIPAHVDQVFYGWLNPKIAGTVWNAADSYQMDPKVDGLFYWSLHGTPHYGRFTEIKKGVRIKHTWMSPNTLGQESMVTVTFKKKGESTVMTLVHSGLPDHKLSHGHLNGWNYFTGLYREQFGDGSKKKFSWDDAKKA